MHQDVAIETISAIICVFSLPSGLLWNSNQHKDSYTNIHILTVWKCAQIHSIGFCLRYYHCYFMKIKSGVWKSFQNQNANRSVCSVQNMNGSLWPVEYAADPLTWLLLNRPFIPTYGSSVSFICTLLLSPRWKNKCQREIRLSNWNPSVNLSNPTKIKFFFLPWCI